MFPDVRLLIAATLASVLALICGFGLFAAFRVSHDPLTRLPPATASLELVADKTARLPVAFAPAESFDRRFPVAAPGEPIAAAPVAAAAVSEDKPGSTAAAQPDTASPAADAPAAVPDATAAEAGHESAASVRSEPATRNDEVAAAPAVAATAPAADSVTAPAEQNPASEAPPSPTGQATLQPATNAIEPKLDEKTADKVPDEKRTWHVGTGTPRHTYKSAHVTLAHAGAQNADFAQGNFSSAAQPAKQPVPKRVARVRTRKPASKPVPSVGIGGPFVSVPAQQ